jgi:hypothetical protein
MKKVFITLAFICSSNSYAFDDLYLSCANSTYFIGITQSYSQKFKSRGQSHGDYATVKKASKNVNGFDSNWAQDAGKYEAFITDQDIHWPGSRINRITGEFFVESIIFKAPDDLNEISTKKIGVCSKIEKSQAINGAKKIFKGKEKTKVKF